MNRIIYDIGIQIKNLRKENLFSQKKLAKKCSIDRSQLSRIEHGAIKGVQFATIFKIFQKLNKQIDFKEDKRLFFPIRPFVKWAGGKTQLLNQIIDNLPKQYNNYFEPFVGGGALLFKLQPKNFFINDINNELVCAYRCFANKNTFGKLKQLLKKHESLHTEDYFNNIRNEDRELDFKSFNCEKIAARFIYLNKSCFNGLYRVNSKGFFNVPSGKKKTVITYDETIFDNIHRYFQNSFPHITCTDYVKAIKNAKKDDFIYFDPPYDVLNKQTFTSYSEKGFGKNEQEKLASIYKCLTKKGVKLMLSNHDTPFIRNLYKEYKIIPVFAKRMINSIGSKRGNVKEVLILNY